ncbi:MAG: sulfotransferase [Gammaproteobacteria bacterium]|nr:sulfotransferase [Gammaproteobacteria bacterium]
MTTVSRKPDFLVIGAARSGTSWLYHNLRQLEGFWLPPKKELHYFDRHIKYPTPSYFHDARLSRRLLGREKCHHSFRRSAGKRVFNDIRRYDVAGLRWSLRYYFSNVDDQWYQSLFPVRDDLVCGEITPGYQILSEPEIEHVARVAPHVKIIFMMRNPIYRTWSQIKKDRSAYRSTADLDRALLAPTISMRNDYLGTIRRWGRVLPRSQLGIFYFDDIVNNPVRVLNEVSSFLRGEDASVKDCINRSINSSKTAEMPAPVKKRIAAFVLHDLGKLASELQGYPGLWLREAERICYGSDVGRNPSRYSDVLQS